MTRSTKRTFALKSTVTCLTILLLLLGVVTPASAQSELPPKPENVRIRHNDVAASVTWNQPAEDGLTYRVWLEGPDLPTCDGTKHYECVLSPLTPDTPYLAHVYTENGEGLRSGDVVVPFTTDERKPRPSALGNVSGEYDEDGILTVRWEGRAGGEVLQAAAWNSTGELLGTCDTTTYYNPDYVPRCEITDADGATRVGARDCSFRGRNVPGLIEPACNDYSIADVTKPVLERPLDPTSAAADKITKTSAEITWVHTGGTAMKYVVWLSDAGEGGPFCESTRPFDSEESCVISGLTPGTDYEANVFAENADGNRSATVQVAFSTLVAGVNDPCSEGGEHFEKRKKSIRIAGRKYAKSVDKWVERLEDRPKKLAKKIKRLKRTRNLRIDRANAQYERAC